MTRKAIILGVFVTVIISLFIGVIYLNFSRDGEVTYKLFHVYLEGKKIGTIENDEELYALIDSEQASIKDEYGVDKIYPPKGLEVSPVFTYKTNIISTKEIYENIKDIDPFTIEGYEVTVKQEKQTIKFNILNLEDLDTAVNNVVTSFVKAEEYTFYLEGKQPKIEDEGTIITKVELGNEMSTKKAYISTEDTIYTNADDITRFFLFGTTEINKYYTVKADDNIESIAWKNQMSVRDFLIANPEIVSENALLSEGQKVNVAEVNPLNDIVVETLEVENQVIKYDTKVEYDNSLDSTVQYTKTKGVNGLAKVEFQTRTVNGVILRSVQNKNPIEIIPVQDEVIVVGANSVTFTGGSKYWAWPTSKPYRISDHFGYRVDPFTKKPTLHTGTDITGVGKNDGIYAIQSGTVTASGYTGMMGYYVIINHGNGYTSQSLHMKSGSLLVKKGDEVTRGQRIGTMGSTGRSTGKHLHLSIKKDGSYINPMNLYK